MTETAEINPLAAIVGDIPVGTKALVVSDHIPGRIYVSVWPAETEDDRDFERLFVSRSDAITWAAEVLASKGRDFSAIIDISKNRVTVGIVADADGDASDDDGEAA